MACKTLSFGQILLWIIGFLSKFFNDVGIGKVVFLDKILRASISLMFEVLTSNPCKIVFGNLKGLAVEAIIVCVLSLVFSLYFSQTE